ncbi:MAG: hypothetical protein JRI68_07905 [Deltaproteobacteria bacterium]|nr:hypothetical protein [Deltaproteobacteria bacterium]
MDLEAVEQELRKAAGSVLADPRLVRRVIKQQRDASGMVPHSRCYAVRRAELFQIIEPAELGDKLGPLPEDVILLARPTPRELRGRSQASVVTRLWRAVFHARIHQVLERRIAAGTLSDAAVRRRIDSIGQTEFDEIRAILKHDDLVLPPYSDREVYVEFAALYYELRYFAPGLLITTFPGLSSYPQVDEVLAKDVDVQPLLEDRRPAEVDRPAATAILGGTSAPSFSAPASFALSDRLPARPVKERAHGRLLRRAAAARRRGNDVKAALLASRAASVEDEKLARAAQAEVREAVASLGDRLTAALRGSDPGARGRTQADWSALLFLLSDRAAATRTMSYAVEARLLYTLQRAAVAFERLEHTVDLATWMLSLTKRPIVRELPATREVRVARHIAAAARAVRHVRIGAADRKLLDKLLRWASERAEHNVRTALRPRLCKVLDEVELVAQSDPERLGRDKLVEELLDQILDGGFLSFSLLRDAISRNQLKLDDLKGGRELVSGDPLLRADAQLATELDGLYERGDSYLRVLQKASSLPFGTKVGRVITLYLVLPLGGSFVILDAIGHLGSSLLGWFGVGPIHPLNWTSFLVTATALLALIHSAPFRAFARQVFEILGLVLATAFFRLPRSLVTLPAVRRWLALPQVRLVLRRVVVPALVGLAVYFLTPFRHRDLTLGIAVALGSFATFSVVMGSRLGVWLEDFALEQLAPTWQVVSRQWAPGLFRLIARFFGALIELLQRAMARVDELIRFRAGQGPVMIVVKGAVGFVWGIFAYFVRLYVTLLVEPEFNPLKHFPVVTVAHKLMLPITLSPAVLAAFQAPLSPFGPIVAGAVAGVTIFLLPSVFGFLAWELKENYKLYRASRPDRLDPAPVGPHGETMRGLLVAGLHSGTLPKLYERLRRAAQRDDEAAVASRLLGRAATAGRGEDGLGRFRQGIRRVEQSVSRFVERELLAPLQSANRWRFGELRVTRLDLSSNRVRVELTCDSLGSEPAELTFEEQSGVIVAGIAKAGFIHQLCADSATGARLLENALAGLYQRAEVDLVREQIEAVLDAGAHYDIAAEGLVVWPGRDYRTELVYRLNVRRGGTIKPKIRGIGPLQPARVIDTRQLLYRAQQVSWLAWVGAWGAADHHNAEIPRLLAGASILPRGEGDELGGDHTPAAEPLVAVEDGPEPVAAAGAQPVTRTQPMDEPDAEPSPVHTVVMDEPSE